jgi:CspA family cold shock protein
MSIGTIKFFNAGKGFGFVTPDGGGPDIFLPSASVTSSGLAGVKPGQRVTFEQAPDPKGTKIVSLKVIAEAPPRVLTPATESVTVFCDLSSPAAAEVLEAAIATGLPVVPLDYMVVPLGIEQLQRLSHQINEAGQTLVRRYDPLFSALQLDDRFIGIQDFWTGIIEHPALINGPVLVRGNVARICKTPSEVRSFLGKGSVDTAAKSKMLSPRMAAILRGEAPPPAALQPVPEPAARKALPELKTSGASKGVTKDKKKAPKPAEKSKTKAALPAKQKKPAKKPPVVKKASKPVKSVKPAKKKAKKR